MRPMPLPPPVTTAVTWETSKIFELSRKVLSALAVVILSVGGDVTVMMPSRERYGIA